MALTLEEIAAHPALHRCIRVQAQAMNQTYEMNPRLASVFATQQRWLMAHIGLALHFRREPDDYRKELTTARFLDAIRQKLPELTGKRILGFNYDTGERYLSVPDFLPEE